jgi:carotenoid 1,2-hydratase
MSSGEQEKIDSAAPAALASRLAERAAIAPALRCASEIGGYAWWYAEIHDPERRFGLTLIVFAGSVFSPRYARLLRSGVRVAGLEVPAVNLALYIRRDGEDWPTVPLGWVMNEHAPATLRADASSLAVGASAVRYLPDGGLRFELDEDTTRFFGRAGERLTGHITVAAPPPPGPALRLGEDARGAAHFWQPMCPRSAATVELKLGTRSIRFRGTAYCDRNYGAGRLEDAFARWGWAHGFAVSGAPQSDGQNDGDNDGDNDGAAVMVYDALRRDGTHRRIAIHLPGPDRAAVVTESLETEPVPARPPAGASGGFFWLRVPPSFAAGPYVCERRPGRAGRLLDAPFYARFAARITDSRTPEARFEGVGEYLDLDRFASRWVQHLLRYKTRHVAARLPG